MEIAKEELLDKLRRAYEMEEVMAADLLDLALPHILPKNVSEEKRSKVHAVISVIRKDTLEHRKIVHGLIQKVSKGMHGT